MNDKSNRQSTVREFAVVMTAGVWLLTSITPKKSGEGKARDKPILPHAHMS